MSGDNPQLPSASMLESSRPEADLEGRLVLEAMRGALFGKRDKPVSVGRYELIERVGSGALGLVVAAHDPELDRRVAIKLLPARVDSRVLLREARALARLSSPHVVAVLDVGTFEPSEIGTLFGGDPGDPAGMGVWLAMELVEGTPIDAWIRKGPHGWREVLEVFLGAGRGLADAHASRIVHRDFKPANVILGNDDRVRVVDFGLARSPNLSFMTSADAVAAADDAALLRGLIGTPAYMAPEQHKGEPTDERADQFAFCVSMYEALYDELPYPGPRYEDFMRDKNRGPPPMPTRGDVPLEIRRALTQGLDVDPALRFESMGALLSALALANQTKPTRNGRLIVGGAVAAIAATAVGYALLSSSRACPVAEADGAAWDRDKDALVSAVSAAPAPYAKVAAFRVAQVLDLRMQAWTAARSEACGAADLSPARAQCVEASRRGIDAALRRLRAMVPAEVSNVEGVLELVPNPAACANATGAADLNEAADLRAEILAARMQARGGAAHEAMTAATAARGAAKPLGVEAIDAEAAFAVGEAAWLAGDIPGADEGLQAAYTLAAAAGDSQLAALAAASVVASRPSREDAGDWIGRARAALGDAAGALAIEVHLAEGSARAGDEAIAAFERARAEVERGTEVSPLQQARTFGALADALHTAGRDDEANARAERALTIVESAFGPGHPQLAAALTRQGRLSLARGQLGDAAHRLRTALEIRESSEADDPVALGEVLVLLAGVLAEQRLYDEARRHLERALEAFDSQGPVADTLRDLCSVLLEQRDLSSALKRCKEALETQTTAAPHADQAMMRIENLLGRVLLEQDDLEAAGIHLDRGLAHADKEYGPDHPAAAKLLLDLAHLRVKQARVDDAVALLDRVAALSMTLGAAHEDVVTAIVERAWMMTEAGDADGALAAVRAHVDRGGTEFGPTQRLELAFASAGAQWKSGQRGEAVMTVRRARQEYSRDDSARPELLARVDAWLAER